MNILQFTFISIAKYRHCDILQLLRFSTRVAKTYGYMCYFNFFAAIVFILSDDMYASACFSDRNCFERMIQRRREEEGERGRGREEGK